VRTLWWTTLLLALALGCNGNGGGGGAEPANANVTGTAAGLDFTFVPAQAGALFEATRPGAGELNVFLCETGCPALGAAAPADETRSLILSVEGTTAELRGGGVFPIGDGGYGRAELQRDGQVVADEALSGEIVIESSDLRDGGLTVGTFQLETVSGGSLSGFFEAPIEGLSGPIVLLESLQSVDR